MAGISAALEHDIRMYSGTLKASYPIIINPYVGFYDDGQPQTHISNVWTGSRVDTLQLKISAVTDHPQKSDYEIALAELDKEFPNIDIVPILLDVSFVPKNTMADAFQNIRYAFLLFLRELFR
jgi:hypothetical protein